MAKSDMGQQKRTSDISLLLYPVSGLLAGLCRAVISFSSRNLHRWMTVPLSRSRSCALRGCGDNGYLATPLFSSVNLIPLLRYSKGINWSLWREEGVGERWGVEVFRCVWFVRSSSLDGPSLQRKIKPIALKLSSQEVQRTRVSFYIVRWSLFNSAGG